MSLKKISTVRVSKMQKKFKNKKSHFLRPVYCPDYTPESNIDDIIRFTLMMRFIYMNDSSNEYLHPMYFFNEYATEETTIPPKVIEAARKVINRTANSDDMLDLYVFSGFKAARIYRPETLDYEITETLKKIPVWYNEIRLNKFVQMAALSLKELHPFLKRKLLNKMLYYAERPTYTDSIFIKNETYEINRIFTTYLFKEGRIPCSYKIHFYVRNIFALDFAHEYEKYYRFMLAPGETGCPLLVFEETINEYKNVFISLVKKYFKQENWDIFFQYMPKPEE